MTEQEQVDTEQVDTEQVDTEQVDTVDELNEQDVPNIMGFLDELIAFDNIGYTDILNAMNNNYLHFIPNSGAYSTMIAAVELMKNARDDLSKVNWRPALIWVRRQLVREISPNEWSLFNALHRAWDHVDTRPMDVKYRRLLYRILNMARAASDAIANQRMESEPVRNNDNDDNDNDDGGSGWSIPGKPDFNPINPIVPSPVNSIMKPTEIKILLSEIKIAIECLKTAKSLETSIPRLEAWVINRIEKLHEVTQGEQT